MMKRNCKICWFLLIIFLIINVVISIIWFGHIKRSRERAKVSMEMRQEKWRNTDMILKDSVGLDTLQLLKLSELRVAHMENVKSYIKQADSLRGLIKEMTFSEQNQPDTVSRLINEMLTVEQQLEWLNYSHFKNIRKVCTADQVTKFDEFFKRTMHRSKYSRGSGRSKSGK